MRKRKVPAKYLINASDHKAIADGCYFDQSKADYVITFIETYLKQSKGRWGGLKWKLLDWQRDLVCKLFGWRRKDGRRRFTQLYCEIPKKNGKSSLVSALCMYFLVADHENGANLVLLAADRKQAANVWQECDNYRLQSPELSELLISTPSQKLITFPATLSKMRAFSAESRTAEGEDSSATIFDELHCQKNFRLWNAMLYAGAARSEPMLISISTAGDNKITPCWDRHQYTLGVNSGQIIDTEFLGIIHAAEPGDNLDDPSIWKKANPSLGVTFSVATFGTELKAARASAISWQAFKRYRFNLWASSDFAFITPELWALNNHSVDIPALAKRRCWVGVDLASVCDTAAIVALFEDGSILTKSFLPEKQLDANPMYRQWRDAGHLILTPGEIIDYEYIKNEIVKLQQTYEIESMWIDPHNATHIFTQIQQLGVNLQFFSQGILSMNAPTKELERLVRSGQLKNNMNPMLEHQICNAIATMDNSENCKLRKDKGDSKIDLAIALVMAVQGRMHKYY